MNDDDITRRLAETLRAEASTVRSPGDAWDRFSEGSMTLVPGPSRRRWLLLPAGVAVATAAAVIGVALGSRSHSTPRPAPIVSPGPPTLAPTVPPTTVAAPVGPVGGPVPKGFVPSSVTFVSASDGWALGTAPCTASPCASIVRTTDGGRTWKGIPAPRDSTVTTIRFADPRNGWAYAVGSAAVWSTHDGGATWNRISVAGEVEDLEAANGYVHVAGIVTPGQVEFLTSPVASDDGQGTGPIVAVGAGPVPTGQIVLHGSTGWFEQVDRTVVGGAKLEGGQWVSWAGPPCRNLGGPALLTAPTGTDLYAACDAGVWTGGPPSEQLWSSHDAGATFARGPDIPLRTVQAIAATPQRVFVAGDTTDGEEALYANVGGSWEPVLRRSGTSWGDVGFTTATQGVAITSHTLFMTRDGGLTWAQVTFS